MKALHQLYTNPLCGIEYFKLCKVQVTKKWKVQLLVNPFGKAKSRSRSRFRSGFLSNDKNAQNLGKQFPSSFPIYSSLHTLFIVLSRLMFNLYNVSSLVPYLTRKGIHTFRESGSGSNQNTRLRNSE